ncbi:hypothetical protein SAMN06265365_105225 [Tistlia consotensis]|uniref:Uncharacterized protein n=1 Tax=Tistlia consotensis USBA 355 TaxID=560819 RepID=A0A1Y6BIM7_9PROT|nr:hypothetical protein [Tistlia consotensis]SMF12231.1 hypothetical protein SAMN05428998_10573 [Tistlia consotensis USBA 355]SNR51245.1 hypothetical protein SAMN06265365_105225 [Tistlia consotensis]
MGAPEDPRKISDVTARGEVYEAMDTYGLTEAQDIAQHLNLPLAQVERVLRNLQTELPLDDLGEEP